MRDLWRALGMLALDAELRQSIHQVAKFDIREEYEIDPGTGKPYPAHPKVLSLHLRNQPDVSALLKIDREFRKRGASLSAYALAEINRWFVQGRNEAQQSGAASGNELIDELEAFGGGIQDSVDVAVRIQSPGFLEAVGVMVADPEFRDKFGKSEASLRDFGFIISDEEEAALRKDFSPSTTADTQADAIFRLGWSGSTCAGRLIPYPGMFHPNM